MPGRCIERKVIADKTGSKQKRLTGILQLFHVTYHLLHHQSVDVSGVIHICLLKRRACTRFHVLFMIFRKLIIFPKRLPIIGGGQSFVVLVKSIGSPNFIPVVHVVVKMVVDLAVRYCCVTVLLKQLRKTDRIGDFLSGKCVVVDETVLCGIHTR